MKRNVLSKTFAALVLSSAALFAGAAQADGARVAVRFGDFCPPLAVLGPQQGHHHPAAWQVGFRHDGFGPVSHVDQRQQHQHQRIVHGIRSGELTPHEARQLRREQREIRHMEQDYWADDGRLTRDEWRRLDRAQDEASRNIWRQKHDYQARY